MSKFKVDDEEEVDYNCYRKESRKSRLCNKWRDRQKAKQDWHKQVDDLFDEYDTDWQEEE